MTSSVAVLHSNSDSGCTRSSSELPLCPTCCQRKNVRGQNEFTEIQIPSGFSSIKNLQWLSSALRVIANPLSLLIESSHLFPSTPSSPFLQFPTSSPGLQESTPGVSVPLEGCTLSHSWALSCSSSLFLDIFVCLSGCLLLLFS